MKSTLIILCTLFSFAAFCQSPKTLTVISTTGLKLREQPNTQSKVIKTLPWGTNVQIMEVTNDMPDTLGIFKHWEEEIFRQGKLEKRSNDILLIGNWVKAKHQKEIGYLFNAFLADTTNNSPKGNGFTLIMEGWYCNSNFHYDPSLYWYGVFESKAGCSLKSVNIRMLNTQEAYANLYYTTDDTLQYLFIVGSKQPLPTGKLNGYKEKAPCAFDDVYSHCKATVLEEAGLHFIPAEQHGKEWKQAILYATNKKGRKQLLEIPDNIRYKGDTYPKLLGWHGDLDGDGKTDYLIHFGEKMTITILFLSSKAEKGQLVKAVAFWVSGYCC
jgi:Bacterial SH3 domain